MNNGNSKSLFVIDLIIIFASFFVVYIHYQEEAGIPIKGAVLMGIIIIIWFLISVNSNILQIDRLSNHFNIIKDILIAYSVLSAITIATVAIFDEFRPNDKVILYPLLFGFIFSCFIRSIALIIIKFLIINGYRQQSVLLIGSGYPARQIITKILSTPEMGFRLIGILAERHMDPVLTSLYLGGLNQFPDVLHDYHIDQVIIVKPLSEEETIRQVIQHCEEKGIRFCLVPDFYTIIPKWTVISNFGGFPVIGARHEPLNIFSNRIIKRTFDIIGSISGLILFSPFLVIISIGVKLSSPGPFLFRQKRIGNNNVEFTLFKFRTMIEQPRHASDTIWTLPDDRRVTSFGRILRRTGLDELPQLWNVLIGDMSIVGPRPEREYYVDKFSMEIPNYRIRHLVKSGITGLAQANGWRGNTSIHKRIENDIYYLEHWSLWLDLKIIFLTLFNRAAWKNAI